jgi:hypothetical protein
MLPTPQCVCAVHVQLKVLHQTVFACWLAGWQACWQYTGPGPGPGPAPGPGPGPCPCRLLLDSGSRIFELLNY